MREGVGFEVDDILKKGDCLAPALSSNSKSKSNSSSSFEDDIICPILETPVDPYQSPLHYRAPQTQPKK